MCGRKVGTVDKRVNRYLLVKCNHCNKVVKYNGLTTYPFLLQIPERNASSGTRFY